ncbi:rCG48576 [Rattus norvegicus]|uniref:RCG48576 n=1 Tax=Rattus norvegicus TaxID=10116 RepID=A6I0J3_RAT|nr:rCG48576 [Rattus norvegicus]
MCAHLDIPKSSRPLGHMDKTRIVQNHKGTLKMTS